jgi:hypothetical protein
MIMAGSDENETEERTGKVKHRSPSYPAAGLETCVRWIQKLYAAEKKSTTSSLIAAKHLGYGSLSGAARVALASLKKFGLLADEGPERVRVSDDAVKLLLNPDEKQRAELVRSLALRVEIIRELTEANSDGLPSDESLRYHLIADRGFNEDAAHTFTKSLRETVRYARLLDDSASVDGDPFDLAEPSPVAESPVGRPAGPAPTQNRIATSADASGTSAVRLQPPGAAGGGPKFPLSDGTVVELVSSKPLTLDTFEELIDYLDVYKKVLAKKEATRRKNSVAGIDLTDALEPSRD